MSETVGFHLISSPTKSHWIEFQKDQPITAVIDKMHEINGIPREPRRRCWYRYGSGGITEDEPGTCGEWHERRGSSRFECMIRPLPSDETVDSKASPTKTSPTKNYTARRAIHNIAHRSAENTTRRLIENIARPSTEESARRRIQKSPRRPTEKQTKKPVSTETDSESDIDD